MLDTFVLSTSIILSNKCATMSVIIRRVMKSLVPREREPCLFELVLLISGTA